MANGVIGSLLVRIGADVKQLLDGTKKGESALQRMGAVGAKAGKALAAGMVTATVAIGALALKGIHLGDTLAKTAAKLSTTSRELSAMRFAAQQTGVDVQTTDMAMQRWTRRLAEAANGFGEAKGAIKELGLDAQALQQLPLDEQMEAISGAMQNVKTDSDRLRIAFKFFDSEGAALVNTLKGGPVALRELFEESRKYGSFLDTTQTRTVQEAADAQGRMGEAFKGVSIQLGAAFAPAVEGAATAIALVTTKVTESLPKLSAMAERFLGIKQAADDLGDATLQTTLVDQIQLLDTINNKLAEAQAVQRKRGGDTPAQQEAVNSLLEQQASTQARINELLKEKVSRTREAKEAEEEARKKAASAGGDGLEAFEVNAAKRIAQMTADVRITSVQEMLAARFELLQESYKTEEELELERYARDLERLNEAEQNKIGTVEEWTQLRQDIEKKHQAELTAIANAGASERERFEAMSVKDKVANVFSSLQTLTAGIATHSKKAFQVNKLAAIGNAIVSTHAGIAKTIEFYPAPLSFAMAAAQGAAGAAQIQAIRSASFGGGGRGTTPSLAGSTPTVNSQPVGQQQPDSSGRVIRIEGTGERYNRGQVRELIEQINEEIADGTRLVFS